VLFNQRVMVACTVFVQVGIVVIGGFVGVNVVAGIAYASNYRMLSIILMPPCTIIVSFAIFAVGVAAHTA
jgi:hypothetical protein